MKYEKDGGNSSGCGNAFFTYGLRRSGAGTTSPFHTEPSISAEEANYWGLYNMHGNVGEWVWDYYGEYSTEQQQSAETGEGNVLIAYFSWGGNTRGIAEEIQRQTGADLFEIQMVEPYSDDYSTVLDQAQHAGGSEMPDDVAAWLMQNGMETQY